jgi:hypothetical protein
MVQRNDDLQIKQGTTYKIQWPLTLADGSPVPGIELWSARAQARKGHRSETVLHEWSSQKGNLVLSDGTLTLVVEPHESSAWAWTTAVYDVELTSVDGDVVRAIEGKIAVDPEVTK